MDPETLPVTRPPCRSMRAVSSLRLMAWVPVTTKVRPSRGVRSARSTGSSQGQAGGPEALHQLPILARRRGTPQALRPSCRRCRARRQCPPGSPPAARPWCRSAGRGPGPPRRPRGARRARTAGGTAAAVADAASASTRLRGRQLAEAVQGHQVLPTQARRGRRSRVTSPRSSSCCTVRSPETPDVHGALRDEVDQPPEDPVRAGRVGTVDAHLLRGALHRGAARRAEPWEARTGPRSPALRRHRLHHLRDDVSRPLHHHQVARPQILAGHVLEIVERGQPHGCACRSPPAPAPRRGSTCRCAPRSPLWRADAWWPGRARI